MSLSEQGDTISEFASNLISSLRQEQIVGQKTNEWNLNSYFGDSMKDEIVKSNSSVVKTVDHNSAPNMNENGRKYVLPTDVDIEDLNSQFIRKLDAGAGEFILTLNLDDSGNPLNLTEKDFEIAKGTVRKVARLSHAEAILLTSKMTGQYTTGHFLIRQSKTGNAKDLLEIRVAWFRNNRINAGKSTLLGVLISGDLDDGRGRARVSLFKHKHELESGRTSSVGMEIMGFDVYGKQVAKKENGRRMNWEDVALASSKVLTFLDLAGHEKYLKTTVFGMTGCSPDYVMLIVGSNAGIIGMTKEHLGLALALNVPVLVVVTKVDMCPANILDSTIKQITKILKSPGCRKIPMFIRDMEDVVVTAQNFVSERICPVFQISSVEGTGLSLLCNFLNLLPVYKSYNMNSPAEFQISDTFSVPGVGTVVSGTLLNGVINTGDTLYIGPDTLGNFTPCVIKSIHRKKVAVQSTVAGQSSSMALKKVKRAFIRKGMMLLGKELHPAAYWEFEAEVLVLYHSSTIAKRYQAMVHCGNVRQTARIISIRQAEGGKENSSTATTVNNDEIDVIRTGDRAIVRFRFLQYPEYLKPGSRVLFREGRTKGVGKILQVIQ